MADREVRRRRMWARAGDVVRMREWRGEGWGWIDNRVILEHGRELGAYGLAFYLLLVASVDEETQEAVVSLRSVEKVLGFGKKRVREAVARLVDLQMVEVKRRRGYPSVYRLLVVEKGKGGEGA